MDFAISSNNGVGPVAFGMARDEVRAKIGIASKSFMKTPEAPFPCDYFEAEGAFFYYDDQGRFEAAEFVSPARPTIDDVALLELSFDEAVSALSSLDSELEREPDSAISRKLGIGIYASLAKDNPSAQVESVIAFRSGYYD